MPAQENDMPTVMARRLVVNPDNPTQGYTLDAFGIIHPFGGATPLDSDAHSQQGAAVDLAIVSWTGPTGYILDCRGGIHPFGGLTRPSDNATWPNAFVPPAPVT